MGRSFSTEDIKQRTRKALGESLRASRVALGYSVRFVSMETGISRQIIYNTEDGKANSTIDTVAVLAGFYAKELRLE